MIRRLCLVALLTALLAPPARAFSFHVDSFEGKLLNTTPYPAKGMWMSLLIGCGGRARLNSTNVKDCGSKFFPITIKGVDADGKTIRFVVPKIRLNAGLQVWRDKIVYAFMDTHEATNSHHVWVGGPACTPRVEVERAGQNQRAAAALKKCLQNGVITVDAPPGM